MIFFLPIRKNEAFVQALNAVDNLDEITRFSVRVLESGFLMIDQAGKKTHSPLYQPEAEALLHMARLINLIDPDTYSSCLISLGLTQSYSDYTTQKRNHPISYQAVMLHCENRSDIQWQDQFFKILRFYLSGQWDDLKDPISLAEYRQKPNDIIFSEEQIKEILTITQAKHLDSLESLRNAAQSPESPSEKYSYKELIQAKRVLSIEFLKDRSSGKSKVLVILEQLTKIIDKVFGNSRTDDFISSFLHPLNLTSHRPKIMGFNFNETHNALTEHANIYLSNILMKFDLSEEDKKLLINELLSLPRQFSSCYSIHDLGRDAEIFSNVGQPWFRKGKDEFYFPSMMVLRTILKYLTHSHCLPMPIQFVTGIIGARALEQMLEAGFRPIYIFSQYPNRNPLNAHVFKVSPCMYTMHDLLYHWPKLFLTKPYLDSFQALKQTLNSYSDINAVQECLNVFYDGDFPTDQSTEFFKLDQKKYYSSQQINFLILLHTVEPLISHQTSIERIYSLLEKLTLILAISSLNTDDFNKCLNFRYPLSGNAIVDATTTPIRNFWQTYSRVKFSKVPESQDIKTSPQLK